MTLVPPVELVAVADLKVDLKNPNKMSLQKFDALKKNIVKYGFLVPVITNKDLVIADGQHRWEAAKALKLDAIPVIRLDVSEVDRRILRQVLNKLHGEHVQDLDDEEFLFLLEAGEFELTKELLAFSDREAKLLLERIRPEASVEESGSFETQALPRVQVGDVWKLGPHRLMCGDSTQSVDVSKLMSGELADLVITDPPYALFGNSTGISGVTDDSMIRPFFRAAFEQVRAVTKPYGHVYVCCDWHGAYTMMNVAQELDLAPKNLIVWDKGSGGLGMMYQNSYELVWFFSNSPKRTTMTKTTSGERLVAGVSNIWRVPRVSHVNREHNAAKPVELMAIPLLASSDEGQLVLDLFGGSGSTLIACEKASRRCCMMEKEPKYCDVIIARWEAFTNQKAVKL